MPSPATSVYLQFDPDTHLKLPDMTKDTIIDRVMMRKNLLPTERSNIVVFCKEWDEKQFGPGCFDRLLHTMSGKYVIIYSESGLEQGKAALLELKTKAQRAGAISVDVIIGIKPNRDKCQSALHH